MVDHNESGESLRSHFPKSILKYLDDGDQKNFGFDGVTFNNAVNSSTFNSSRDWFGKYSLLSEIDGEAESNEHIMKTKGIFDNATRVSWSESKIGATFREKLKGLEASRSLALFSPTYQQKDFLWACTSFLSNGFALLQKGEIWMDNTDHSEFIFWHTEALIRTRPPKNDAHSDQALRLHIPRLFQSAMYLGENVEHHLSDSNLQRSAAFSANNRHDIPRIVMHTESDCLSFGLKFVEDHYEPDFMWAPQSIRLGYVFEPRHLDLELEIMLESVINSLSRVTEILADGYCNFSESSEENFQSVCFSDRSKFISDSIPAMELGDFVPGFLYSELNYMTQDFFQSSHINLEHALEVNDLEQIANGLKGLQSVMNEGCGPSFMSAANSLFYFQFTKLSESQRDVSWLRDAKVYLKYVSEINFGYENANALSNLAGASIEERDFETALDYVTRGQALLIDAPFPYSEVKLELMGYQLKIYQGLGLNLEATNFSEEIISWVRGRTLTDQQEIDIYSEARATLKSSPKHQSMTLKMLAELGKEARDGAEFELLNHLEISVQRGSKLAGVQLDTVNYFLHNTAALFDEDVRDTFQIWENRFRELFSVLDCDLDDFVLSDEFEEVYDELSESWAEYFDIQAGYPIYPETLTYIFENLRKSKIEIGPFGSQGSGESGSDHYQISHYAENLVLSPFIPRTLLWDISIGEFANDMTFFQARGDYLDTLPSYLVGICASPTTSLNLLKAINEVGLDSQVPGFCEYVKTWVQFPLLVNPVSDIWLLAKLESAHIANSFFDSYLDLQDMSEDIDSLNGGVLFGYSWDFLTDGVREVFKLSQELAFDEDLFAAALLAQRIIEEFKCERARIDDHVDSESGIVRAVVFCSPELDSATKQGINQEDSVFENQKFLDLITSLWSRNDLSVVI